MEVVRTGRQHSGSSFHHLSFVVIGGTVGPLRHASLGVHSLFCGHYSDGIDEFTQCLLEAEQLKWELSHRISKPVSCLFPEGLLLDQPHNDKKSSCEMTCLLRHAGQKFAVCLDTPGGSRRQLPHGAPAQGQQCRAKIPPADRGIYDLICLLGVSFYKFSSEIDFPACVTTALLPHPRDEQCCTRPIYTWAFQHQGEFQVESFLKDEP